MLYKYIILSFLFLLNASLHINSYASEKKAKEIKIYILPTGDKKLDKILNNAKKDIVKKAKNTSLLYQIDYLEDETLQKLTKLLNSLGYYSANIDVLEKINGNDTITFSINLGEPYKIKQINLIVLPESKTSPSLLKLPKESDLKLRTSDVAISTNIIAEEQRIEEYMACDHCLTSLFVHHSAILNKTDHSVIINYNIKAGYSAHISKILITGQKNIEKDYIRKLITLKDGECFNITKINEAKYTLQNSGLFAKIDPLYHTVPDSSGGVDLIFDVKERAPRTVKAGVKYSTDIGIGIASGFEHRNFMGRGENFSANISLSKKEQILESTFIKPFFLSDKQKLKVNSEVSQKDSKAYLSRSLSTSMLIERSLSRYWSIGSGGKYQFEYIKDTKQKDNFALFSIPVYAERDSRDEEMDPTNGQLFSVQTSPFIDIMNRKNKFLKNNFKASCYLSLPKTNSATLALRLSLGSISSKKSHKVPATERFFAGGGNSIRGYRYQLAGPLNEKKEPLGGLSSVEMSTELRLRFNDTLGAALFVDAGNVFESKYPKLNKKLFFGTGIGLRYYTSFAPLRLDIAFPVNKRKKIDGKFEIYFSIGQSF